jgi:hypothetical protein
VHVPSDPYSAQHNGERTNTPYVFVVHLTTLSLSHTIFIALNDWIMLNNEL